MDGKQLRAALAAHRKDSGKGPYPRHLRVQASAYAKKQLSSGVDPSQIACELGVRTQSVHTWLKANEQSVPPAALIPLVLRQQEPQALEGSMHHEPAASLPRFDLDLPSGIHLRATGYAANVLVDIVQALGRP